MASRTIGIEIGSDTLKLSVVKGDKVEKMVSARMPDHLVQEGRVVSAEMLSSFIKDLLKSSGIRGGKCAFVIPPPLVISLQLTLPLMSEEELNLNLPYEFHDYVGKDGDEFTYDYIVNGIQGNFIDLYAVAVRNNIMEDYWGIFKKAGLTMKAATPAEMAWSNIIANAGDAPKKLAIVDVGHASTRISIFADGKFVMCKAVNFAGQLFDETISSELHVDSYAARSQKEANQEDVLDSEFMHQPYGAVAIEVMRVISFYNYSLSAEEEPLRDVYFCGGSSKIEKLRNAIQTATELEIKPVSQLLGQEAEGDDQALQCTLSVGAALQLQ